MNEETLLQAMSRHPCCMQTSMSQDQKPAVMPAISSQKVAADLKKKGHALCKQAKK